MRYHLTPFRMGTIKEKEKNKCWQGCGEVGTLVHSWWNIKWCSCYGKQYGGSSKSKHRILIWPSNSNSGCISQRIGSRGLKRCLHTYVHSNTIHNQKVEATQVSINRWMDKQGVVHPYNGISFSLKKERNSEIGYNMDEPWGYRAEWNRPVTKGSQKESGS